MESPLREPPPTSGSRQGPIHLTVMALPVPLTPLALSLAPELVKAQLVKTTVSRDKLTMGLLQGPVDGCHSYVSTGPRHFGQDLQCHGDGLCCLDPGPWHHASVSDPEERLTGYISPILVSQVLVIALAALVTSSMVMATGPPVLISSTTWPDT